LLWALSGERQVGLMRFYPSFEGLNTSNIFTHPAISKSLMLGIAIGLITVTVTGITMDRGKSIGLNGSSVVSAAHADDSEDGMSEAGESKEGLITEAHELFGNILLLFVGMHVAYLFVFKRPLAKFMLFVPKPNNKP
jgi:cytochrome b561